MNLLQYQMEDADNPAAKPSMRYHEPVGTVTHLAPETMVQGSRLDHTVDIYAFGILMWCVCSGGGGVVHSRNQKQEPGRGSRAGRQATSVQSHRVTGRARGRGRCALRAEGWS